MFIIQIILHHMQSPHRPTAKYNKVSQQKKFHLLTLIYKKRVHIKEAAAIVGVNYLTAKTIVFFHKNNYKSYQFDLQPLPHGSSHKAASFLPVRKISAINEKLIKPKSRIEVICSIGNVLSPCSPISYPEGELTGQFASKSNALLDLPQGLKVPSLQKAFQLKFSPFDSNDFSRNVYDQNKTAITPKRTVLG